MHLRCKIHLPMGKSLTADECRVRVKAWCLYGQSISPKAPDGRKQHLAMRPRHFELGMTESDMDELAESMA